ncbi:MAG: nicotinate phosphoribosyltransferase [Planctomycetes bacterium]|nr:nicotinate phosphoribosyltransferase [Planctomycetota bacterium]
MNYNILLDTDSYKASHFLQYPPGTEGMYSYLESRGGRYGQTVFFGLQYLLSEYLSKPVTAAMVDEAREFFAEHGVPFNYEGWMDVVNRLGGRLPISIRAVPEGTLVPTSNVLMTVESTDKRAFWTVGYLETVLMRMWYPITVATQSWHIRRIISDYLERTSDNASAEIGFKLHDFGSRGVSSSESAAIGGAAHLVNFIGSDTVAGARLANQVYGAKMAAFSIPAAEHSTVTAWGREGEVDAYRNMLTQFAKPGKIVAVVSDSYDLWHAIEKLWCGTLKREVIDSGATVVIRPDSGNPPEVVLRAMKMLAEGFGTTFNTRGFKVLNHVRVIQGDGVNEDSIREILEVITRAGFSATNLAFGMGGALLQKLDRDTQKFAFKCSEITRNGHSVPVFKDPVTDPGKTSKKGRLDLILRNGHFRTVSGQGSYGSVLEEVFRNGEILRRETFDEIRARANPREEMAAL